MTLHQNQHHIQLRLRLCLNLHLQVAMILSKKVVEPNIDWHAHDETSQNE